MSEVTTFDFGDVCLGTVESDDRVVNAQGKITFGRRAVLQLAETASGRLDRLKDLESGFVTFVGADGLELTDRDYRAIAAIPGLRSVDFDDTTISDEQVAYFCNDGMIGLNLATQTVTDHSMAAIASVSTLQHLFISRSSVTDVGMRELRNHAVLEALHAAATGVSAASADVIATLPALTTLEMPGADDSVLVAAARPHTEFLHLRTGSVSAVGIDALGPCASLTWLGLMDARLDDGACEALAHIGALETLLLNESTFDDEALARGLRGLGSLRSLIINDSSAGDGVLAAFDASSQLAAVHARRSNVTDAGVAYLASVPSLEHVDFEGTSVTEAGLGRLAQLPHPFVMR